MKRAQSRQEQAGPAPLLDTQPFRKRSRLKKDQVVLFGILAGELSRAWRQGNRQQLSTLPEYNRFVMGAYACAFVCTDFSLEGPTSPVSYDRLLENPLLLDSIPLQSIRHVVHTLVRRERWNFEAIDEPTGTIRRALDSGLIDQLARHLEKISESAGT